MASNRAKVLCVPKALRNKWFGCQMSWKMRGKCEHRSFFRMCLNFGFIAFTSPAGGRQSSHAAGSVTRGDLGCRQEALNVGIGLYQTCH